MSQTVPCRELLPDDPVCSLRIEDKTTKFLSLWCQWGPTALKCQEVEDHGHYKLLRGNSEGRAEQHREHRDVWTVMTGGKEDLRVHSCG